MSTHIVSFSNLYTPVFCVILSVPALDASPRLWNGIFSKHFNSVFADSLK